MIIPLFGRNWLKYIQLNQERIATVQTISNGLDVLLEDHNALFKDDDTPINGNVFQGKWHWSRLVEFGVKNYTEYTCNVYMALPQLEHVHVPTAIAATTVMYVCTAAQCTATCI